MILIYIKCILSNIILRSFGFRKRRSKISMFYKRKRHLAFSKESVAFVLSFYIVRRICSSRSWRTTIIYSLYTKFYRYNVGIYKNGIGIYRGWNIIVGVPGGKRPREDSLLTDINSWLIILIIILSWLVIAAKLFCIWIIMFFKTWSNCLALYLSRAFV